MPETRVGHFCQFAGLTRADPGAARGALAEQAHLTEELSSGEVGQNHLVAFLVLNHHFDRAADDVVEDIRQITGVNEHGLGRHRANAAIAQEAIDRRNVPDEFDLIVHFADS